MHSSLGQRVGATSAIMPSCHQGLGATSADELLVLFARELAFGPAAATH